MVPLREVVDELVSTIASDTGKGCGDSVAPDGATVPYTVVYRIPGGGPESSLDHGNQREVLTIQTTCVGVTAEQATWMQDKVRTVMLDLSGFTPPSGFTFAHVNLDLAGGVTRDDDEGTEPLFYAIDRYRLWVFPT